MDLLYHSFYAVDNRKSLAKKTAQNKMLYTIKVVATMNVSFAAGLVLQRMLWKFFDWILDAMEKWDEDEHL